MRPPLWMSWAWARTPLVYPKVHLPLWSVQVSCADWRRMLARKAAPACAAENHPPSCTWREGNVCALRPSWTCKQAPRLQELVWSHCPWPTGDRSTPLTTFLLSFSRKFFQARAPKESPKSWPKPSKNAVYGASESYQCFRCGEGWVLGEQKCEGNKRLSHQRGALVSHRRPRSGRRAAGGELYQG